MDAESLSLEETNKVRVSLGLAPLTDDAGTSADAGGDGAVDNNNNNDDEDPDSIAEANWAQRRDEERRAREEKETKERLAKARNQRELRAKLQGKGLGEADAPGEDGVKASDWIKKSRKAAKLRAAELEKLRQREKELEERDREAVYDENDLSGLKVGHGLDDFEEGKDVVLTLKDNKVLEEDDDELQNVNLAEYARTAERLDVKKRGKTAYKYTGFDDDEFDAFNQGKDRGVLSKYDEVIGESSRSGEGFRLGEGASNADAGPSGSGSGSSSLSLAAARKAAAEREEEKQKQLRRDLLSLDYTKTEQTDYLQEGDVGFKKPKKKKKRSDKPSSSRRMATLDGDDEDAAAGANGDAHMAGDDDDAQVEDQKPKIPTAERRLAKEGGLVDGGVIDDDDMQAALARQRRAANKKRLKILKGEDLARQLLEERNGSMPVDGDDSAAPNGHGGEGTPEVKKEEDVDDDDDAEGGIVLDDTSEFIRNISARPVIAKREHASSSSRLAAGSATPDVHVNGNGNDASSRLPRVKSEPRDDGDVPLDEMDVKQEQPEEGEAMDEDDAAYPYNDDERDRLRATSTLSEDVKPGTITRQKSEDQDEGGWQTTKTEKHHTSGLANTLAMLKTTGDVKPLTPQEMERERAFKERERFKAEIAKAEMEAELERQRNRATGQNKDQAQREYENKQRAYNQAQRQMEAFKNYKPNVEISYTDEFGRDLTPKEAWKDLSHKFHGKGSGTNKREKLLKKIADERKRAAMSAGDTPMGTNAAFQARQERTGSATMVLGVGNRNAAPSADALLGSSAGRADLNVAKNKAGQSSSANKRKRTEPKVLG